MRKRLRETWKYGLSPSFMRRFNYWSMVVFLVLIPPSITWWKNSIPLLVAYSVWANFAGHLSAWQSSRVEERQEDGAV